MQTMTTYLSNIMNSTLLSLPREIKELIYFDALSHAADKILVSAVKPKVVLLVKNSAVHCAQDLPLSPEVKHINPNGVAALAKDVQYLTAFVDSLENGPMLRSNLDVLQQTINLMESDNHDEFFDNSMRNKKFGMVDVLKGKNLLDKYAWLHHLTGLTRLTHYRLTSTVQGPSRTTPLANFGSRFGL
jgi:exocyst complex component 6